MKNNRNINKAILDGVLIIAVVFGIASCKDASKPEDTKEVAEQHNDAKFDNKNESDAQFLVDAAEINLMEIQLGNLAAEKGMMAEVKNLGKMMASSHSKSLDDLKELAKKKSVTIPTILTDEGQEEYRKINEKQGKDFDIKYCDMMVDGHKDAIDRFEKAVNNTTDEDVKQWANSTLSSLRTHLDHSMTCQQNCKKL